MKNVGLFIFQQNLIENRILIELLMFLHIIIGYTFLLFGKKRLALNMFSQAHRSTKIIKVREMMEPVVFRNMNIYHTNVFTTPKNLYELKSFSSRMLVLKPPVSKNEKGVLFIMFSEIFKYIPQIFDMERLLDAYTLVFEPSWSGYCDKDILHFTKYKQNIFILSLEPNDLTFLSNMRSNLIPVNIGSNDWVDPKIAEPFLNLPKKYDIVMNALWKEYKRHRILFKAISEIPQKLNVALIGMPWGMTQSDILDIAKYYKISDQISIFEKIPFPQVMEITCQAKLGILCSLKEGANRALSEQLFCNVPIIVLKENIGGACSKVNNQTGVLVWDKYLSEGIVKTLNDISSFSPRKWAIDNCSCFRTTEKLNAILKADSLKNNCQWTRDIVPHSNSPEIKYCDEKTNNEYKTYNEQLVNFYR